MIRRTIAFALTVLTAGCTGGASSPPQAPVRQLTGTITEFPVPNPGSSSQMGIAAGPDGNLWFTVPASNFIGRITTAGVVTDFFAGITTAANPFAIAADPTATCGSPNRPSTASGVSRRPERSPSSP